MADDNADRRVLLAARATQAVEASSSSSQPAVLSFRQDQRVPFAKHFVGSLRALGSSLALESRARQNWPRGD
jgi:hypothetical protein